MVQEQEGKQQMTEAEIQELRSRIAEVEDDFSRRANILLDDILLTRDQVDENARSITESRRDIDQLAQRTGELAQSISELRGSIEAVNQARREDISVMVTLADTLSASIRDLRETQLQAFQQTNADRQTFQAEIRRIWEYLLQERPNGRGDG